MKKILIVCGVLLLCAASSFAEEVVYHAVDVTNEVTGDDILTILKAVGCGILGFIGVPMIIIGFFCAGIRAIRGFLNI